MTVGLLGVIMVLLCVLTGATVLWLVSGGIQRHERVLHEHNRAIVEAAVRLAALEAAARAKVVPFRPRA